MRFRNLFSLLVFIFALISGTFQSSVQAIEIVSEETLSIIGDDATGMILPETAVEYEENIMALDLLLKAVGENNVEVSESSFGKMITGIKGLEAKGNFYWAFYINGISAQIGADQYVVQKGDQISFQYIDWSVTTENTVSITVKDSKGVVKEASNIVFIEKPTALQLLKVLLGDKVVTEETQYGIMISEINGLKMEGTNYWAFYVNEKMATVGADVYTLNAGDRISFQYESWDSPTQETEDTNKNPIENKFSKETIQKSIDLASQYVLKNQVGEWEAIALRQAGKTIPKDYLRDIITLVKEKKGKFSKVTDYERYTLGILAAGGNPTNISGYNLVESIYNGELTRQGLNGVFYGLIALDSGDFAIPENSKWSREKLVAYLLDRQNKDKGWSWDGSETSDPDTTAMVLTALAPYKGQEKVGNAINTAVQYLSALYQDGKIDNSSTAAQMVIGLSTVGVDANDLAFLKDKTSLISYLLSFQNKDGGFDWQGGEVSDVFSTAQGIQGMVAYQLLIDGKGTIYKLPVEPKLETDSKEASKNSDNQEGKPLPNTSTNTFNIMFFGFFLLLIGCIFLILERRKKA